MGTFTAWIAEWRKNRHLQMQPEMGERLARDVFESVVRRLRAAITPRFGIPDAHDLASEQYLALLGCLGDPDRSLTSFVKDTPTLTHWLYRESWSRFCRTLQKKSLERGPSSLGNGPSGAQGMEGVEDFSSELDAQDVETKDIIERSLEDMERVGVPDARAIFEKAILQGRTLAELGAEMGIDRTTIGRRLEACKFCFARRYGWSSEQLEDVFGQENARRWTDSLEAGEEHG